MHLDTFVMIARDEQERRIAEAAKQHLLSEVEKARRGSRAGIFSRRTRNAQ
jgi:hypothetical protein